MWSLRGPTLEGRELCLTVRCPLEHQHGCLVEPLRGNDRAAAHVRRIRTHEPCPGRLCQALHLHRLRPGPAGSRSVSACGAGVVDTGLGFCSSHPRSRRFPHRSAPLPTTPTSQWPRSRGRARSCPSRRLGTHPGNPRSACHCIGPRRRAYRLACSWWLATHAKTCSFASLVSSNGRSRGPTARRRCETSRDTSDGVTQIIDTPSNHHRR